MSEANAEGVYVTNAYNDTGRVNSIIQIDLSKIKTNDILDLSSKEKAANYLSTPFTVNASAAHKEILIFGDIPQEAIVGCIKRR